MDIIWLSNIRNTFGYLRVYIGLVFVLLSHQRCVLHNAYQHTYAAVTAFASLLIEPSDVLRYANIRAITSNGLVGRLIAPI